MGRSPVSLRPATVADAPALVAIWRDVIRRVPAVEQTADLEFVVKAAAASPEERVIVAEVAGEVVGAVHLRVGTLSAVNLEPVVQAIAPHVLPAWRRHGIGTLLVEQAVVFAEEVGVVAVATAADSNSREANRFMARLALSPKATMRVGSAVAVRTQLEVHRSSVGSARHLARVLAVRRSQRRQAGDGSFSDRPATEHT